MVNVVTGVLASLPGTSSLTNKSHAVKNSVKQIATTVKSFLNLVFLVFPLGAFTPSGTVSSKC